MIANISLSCMKPKPVKPVTQCVFRGSVSFNCWLWINWTKHILHVSFWSTDSMAPQRLIQHHKLITALSWPVHTAFRKPKPAAGDVRGRVFKITEFYKLLYQNICLSALFTVYCLWLAAAAALNRAGCRKHLFDGKLSLVFILQKLMFLDWSLVHDFSPGAHSPSLLFIFSSTVTLLPLYIAGNTNVEVHLYDFSCNTLLPLNT